MVDALLLVCLQVVALGVASSLHFHDTPPLPWESSRWYWWPPLVGQVKEGGVAAGAEDSNTPAVATLKEEHSAAVATLKEEHSAAAHNTITRVKRQDLITLPTPTDLRKTSTGADYVDIEWKYEGDQGSVEFLVKVYYSGAERVFAKDQVVRGTSVRVDGLAPSTTYLMTVSAFKALPRGRRATSLDSQLITAKIPDLVLSPPSSLRVTDSSRDLINLEWQYDGNQNDVEFLVNVYYSGGVLLRDLPVKGRTSVTVDGLTPDTDYTFSVKAFKALPRGLRAFSDSSPTITGTTRVTPRPTPRPQPPRPPTPRPQPPETTTSPSILRPDTRPPAVGCTHGMCSCPPPNQHFCVACDRLSLCERVEDESVCSIEPAAMGVNMTVTVLSCGPQVTLNLRDFVRSDKGLLCGSATGVPVDTVVIAECWRSATYLSQCHADGKWHPYGRHQTQAPSSQHLCQPHAVNSLVCGRRPPYQNDAVQILSAKPQWPWLVGVFRKESYACTATIISPRYLLTAAHCLTRTQSSSRELVDLRELMVQYLNTNGYVVRKYVKSGHLYPGFVAGRRPTMDVGLISVEEAIVFSYHVQPACIHTQGFPSQNIAATFKRSNQHYGWELILQQHDPRCHSPQDACAKSLNLHDTQFCATDAESTRLLSEGSSGGPYLVNVGKAGKEQWSVVGVVSSSYSRDSCDTPLTIYSSLAEMRSWISKCVDEGICS